MLSFNGTDYTLIFFFGTVIALFGLEFLICRMTRRPFFRWLPMGYVAALLALSVACMFGDTGGFIDVRSFFALVILGYAAVCAVSIGLGWLLGRRKTK